MTMNRRPALSLALVPALGLVAACDVSYELVDELEQAESCPINVCGGNAASPAVELDEEAAIPWLHLYPGQSAGLPNQWGNGIVGFAAPNGAQHLRVEHGRFEASFTADGPALPESDLIGAQIFIENDDSGWSTDVVIHAHRKMPAWTSQGLLTDQYVLKVYNADLDAYVPVCSDATSLDDEKAWATLISEELYDWARKEVVWDWHAENWFTIACTDNATYKMKMMGYDADPIPDSPHPATSWQQRQAAFKMLTGDYCGTGKSFTEDGTSLHWVNRDEWSYNFEPSSSTFEAYWRANGATCLDTPRLGMDMKQSILNACAAARRQLPPCGAPPTNYDWLTEKPE